MCSKHDIGDYNIVSAVNARYYKVSKNKFFGGEGVLTIKLIKFSKKVEHFGAVPYNTNTEE